MLPRVRAAGGTPLPKRRRTRADRIGRWLGISNSGCRRTRFESLP